MKKILIPFDGTNFSEGAFEFARRLSEHQTILLVGAFLPLTNYANLWTYAGSGIGGPVSMPVLDDEEVLIVNKNIERFESLCVKSGIEYRVHKSFTELAQYELIKEARFADMVILGSQSFYKQAGTTSVNDNLKDVLYELECPVIVVPEKYYFPENNIIAYDGSACSAYAVKQFAYLLPELAVNSTTLMYVNEGHNSEFPDEALIEELAARHYTDLTVMKLELNPKKHLVTWLTDEQKPILITGSFGRKGLSVFFHKSFVRDVISEHKVPVFIAH
jgi:nucleotide-binding universal stress UspA family protein